MRIKIERLAERCEICHQTDMFDAEGNHCFRCEKVSKSLKGENVFAASYTDKILLDNNKLKSAFVGTIICGLLLGMCLLPSINLPYLPLLLIPLSGFVASWFYIYKLRMFINPSGAIKLGVNTGIQFTVFLLIVNVVTAPLFEHFDSYVLGAVIFLSPIIIFTTVVGSLFGFLLLSKEAK